MKVLIGRYHKDPNKKRKIDVRIDDHDLWSMDYTLSLIIHPMLVKLKEDKNGSPFVDDEDVPEHLRSANVPPKENDWDTDDLVHDRWDWVLDEMIWAFEHRKNDEWKDLYYKAQDYAGLRDIEIRMRNGFCLFGKYFEGLWS
jgi:hypothetical protein